MRLATLYRNFKKIISWIPIIWKDRDYDYEYLFDIERKKLSQMLTYFQTSPLVHKREICRDIQICINLLDIVCKKADEYLEMPKDVKQTNDFAIFNHRVNWRNAYRFLNNSQEEIEKQMSNPNLLAHILNDIYTQKALHLYYKILFNKVRSWWD